MAYQRRNEGDETEMQALAELEEEEEELDEGHLTIFSRIVLPESVKQLVGKAELEAFSQPLINRALLKDKVGLLERLLGGNAAQANAMSDEIITDMQLATDYPPYYEGILLPVSEVIPLANTFLDYVTSLKNKPESEE